MRNLLIPKKYTLYIWKKTLKSLQPKTWRRETTRSPSLVCGRFPDVTAAVWRFGSLRRIKWKFKALRVKTTASERLLWAVWFLTSDARATQACSTVSGHLIYQNYPTWTRTLEMVQVSQRAPRCRYRPWCQHDTSWEAKPVYRTLPTWLSQSTKVYDPFKINKQILDWTRFIGLDENSSSLDIHCPVLVRNNKMEH